jgi:hypothetical protein
MQIEEKGGTDKGDRVCGERKQVMQIREKGGTDKGDRKCRAEAGDA